MVKGQKSKEQLDSLFFTFHFSLFTYMSTLDFWSNYDCYSNFFPKKSCHLYQVIISLFPNKKAFWNV